MVIANFASMLSISLDFVLASAGHHPAHVEFGMSHSVGNITLRPSLCQRLLELVMELLELVLEFDSELELEFPCFK